MLYNNKNENNNVNINFKYFNLNENIENIIFISDTHFGIKNNSNVWLDDFKLYFENYFLEIIKKINKNNNSILIHLGDVFDNRQLINLKTLNFALEIFKKISKEIQFFILCGNHDSYYKNSTDINSIKIFENINNIYTINEPTILKIDNDNDNEILLLQWIEDNKILKDIINIFISKSNSKNKYLCCHAEIQGAYYYRDIKIDAETLLSNNNLFSFKRVFSGHIHYRQEFSNVVYIGCPYPLTRADINNEKGIYVYNIKNDKLEFIRNDFSPKFKQIKLSNILESNLETLEKIFNNNYIDIIIDKEYIKDFPINLLTELFNEIRYKSINFNFENINALEDIKGKINEIYDENDNSNNFDDLNYLNNNIIEIFKEYINEKNYDEKIKNKLILYIIDLYNYIVKHFKVLE